MLEKLNKLNDMKIYSIYDDEFKTFGKILKGYDFSELINYMERETDVPLDGNIYIPSVDKMECMDIYNDIKENIYGDMPIQIGLCNGRNSNYNAFEYHKGNEVNIAVTPLVIVLGHVWDLDDGKYYVGNEKVFYVPEGTAFEMYSTTLHFSPCKVSDDGFKNVIILPKGTNTPLDKKGANDDPETKLLFARNKWLLAHKDRKPLMEKGAFPGLIGENKEIRFKEMYHEI